MPIDGAWTTQQVGSVAGQAASLAHSTNWVPFAHCAAGAHAVLSVLIDTQHTCEAGQDEAPTHAALEPPRHAVGLLAATHVCLV